MTDTLDNLANDGSNNDAITKLFPKCKPKTSSDVNLNKILKVERYGIYNSNSNTATSAAIAAKENYQNANENEINVTPTTTPLFHHWCADVVGGSIISPNHNERSLSRDLERNANSGHPPCRETNLDNCKCSGSVRNDQQVTKHSCNKGQCEDHSVVSAYDHCSSNMDRNGHTRIALPVKQQQALDDVVYDDSLDVGYRVPVGRDEFRLRESRIEIAGGREVFSSSRSRPSKKRFSDEILYNRPSSLELKRHSGEVLYNDKLGGYHFKSTTQISNSGELHGESGGGVGGWTEHDRPRHYLHSGKVVCDADDTQKDRGGLCDVGTADGCKSESEQPLYESGKKIQKETFVLKGKRSGMFIYETVVCGTAEVVYDDIGDWVERNNVGDGKPSTVVKVQAASMEESSLALPSFLEGQGNGCPDIFQRRLNISTEAVNSEDFLSEREDGGSSQEDESSPSSIGGKGLLTTTMEIAKREAVGRGDASMHAQNHNRCPSSSDEMDVESGQSSPNRKSVAGLIGSLPIAQYEGSPRRYGPRPGHPQRVTAIENSLLDAQTPTNAAMVVSMDSLGKDDTGVGEEHQHVRGFVSDVMAGSEQSGTSSRSLNCDGKEETKTIASGATLPFSLADYNYQYEESETRKVLEEFYRQDGLCARLKEGGTLTAEEFRELEYRLYRVNAGNSYVGRRLAQSYIPEVEDSPKKRPLDRMQHLREHFLAASLSMVNSSLDIMAAGRRGPALSEENVFHFNMDCPRLPTDLIDHDGETVSTNPDTEDLGETEVGEQVGQSRNFTLSPETTECDSNDVESEVSIDNEGSLNSGSRQYSSMPVLEDGLSSGHCSEGERGVEAEGEECDSDREVREGNLATLMMKKQISEIEKEIARRSHLQQKLDHHQHHYQHFQQPQMQPSPVNYREVEEYLRGYDGSGSPPMGADLELEMLDPLRHTPRATPPPPPAPHPHRPSLTETTGRCESVSEAINEIKQAIRKTKNITLKSPPMEKPEEEKPVWVLRPAFKPKTGAERIEPTKERDGKHENGQEEEDCDTDQETDRLLGKQRTDEHGFFDDKEKEAQKKKERTKEVLIHEPAVLIEGVLFRAKYLGSTQLVCEGQPTKATRMMQAEEAVSQIKAPEGETQPNTEVDLFISTEKIMVLNTDLKEILMDHALRTISYIADIGDLVVLMARRRVLNSNEEPDTKVRRTPKMICHVFESEEAQFIAQSIGQAFQVAYMEFLKANGIEDHSFVKEMDYQEVLNSQEIFGDELEMFAKKEMQKEVIVPKLKGEILGVVIVESGWGSMLPTVVIANLSPSGAAARCGQLNIGDQIIAINGISLVGLPLSTCQNYIKNTRNQTVVKLTVVPCAPVVEVKIKRPDTKYQLGFSVQNGVICSLLRGGIAERGGVRVGHRIIEINGQSVVAVPHERIVNLLATSVGEIHMKTMPTSMFRLLTGQEVPVYI